jgi:hypothetical protein
MLNVTYASSIADAYVVRIDSIGGNTYMTQQSCLNPVLFFSANNVNSYSGSGNTWFNLGSYGSGSEYNLTRTGGGLGSGSFSSGSDGCNKFIMVETSAFSFSGSLANPSSSTWVYCMNDSNTAINQPFNLVDGESSVIQSGFSKLQMEIPISPNRLDTVPTNSILNPNSYQTIVVRRTATPTKKIEFLTSADNFAQSYAVSGSVAQIESAYDGMNFITNATFNAISVKAIRVYDTYLEDADLIKLPTCNAC